MPRMTAGQAVVEALRLEGVRYIFGVVGSSFLEVLDALYDRDDIRFLGVRHEQAGAFMAEAYARASGIPAVCMVTNGPGAANLVTGIAAAYVTHSPVVVIVGTPGTQFAGRDSFQELDHISLFRPITKLTIQVPQPQRIPELLRHAFRTAMSGKMGPVFVDIPRDILGVGGLEMDFSPPEQYRPGQRSPGDADQVRRAAELLRSAQRPLIIAGGGVIASGATDVVVELADALAIPMVTSYARNDAAPNDHPLYVGPLGRASSPEAGEITRQADVILAVGTRLAHFTGYYDNRYITAEARIVQIEIDQKEIGRNFPVAVGILGDARAVVEAVHQALRDEAPLQGREAWVRQAHALKDKRRQRLEVEASLSTMPLKPQRVYAELRRAMPEDAIVCLDAGAAVAYSYDRLTFQRPGTLFTSMDLGTLGYGFPAALGVKLARPQAPVVAIHGDGGFLMNAQDLATAVQENIPVVCLVMNNNCWGSEKAYQKYFYDERYVGADITNPRFDRFAEVMGAKGMYVERAEDIGDALREALASGRPTIIEVPVDPEELPVPPRGVERATRGS